jgi:ATP-dependent protease HslVU (ClpYQ) peptidase subunit
MTTIAYKDGVIAYDSRVCCDRTILDDDYDKRAERDGVHYFFCGAMADREFLIAHDRGERRLRQKCDSHALIWDGKNLWEAGFDQNGIFWKSPKRLDNPCAIGSGTDHALTAMDMGADAAGAVEMAAKRDVCTGGTVRTALVAP